MSVLAPAMTAVAPALAAGVVRVLGLTLRVTVVGRDAVLPLWRERRPVIYALWHGRILMLPWLSRRFADATGPRTIHVLASRSRDGELITRFVRRFGLAAVRGSSSRGGVVALRALVAALRAGDDVVVVPDGPRGPARTMQPGLAALAALSGAAVVPLAFAAHPAWRLPTWDGFVVPAPFARGALAFGTPVHVAASADRKESGAILERALDATTTAADRAVAS